LFTLDRQSAVPLAAQIEQQLRLLLERGQLAAGARLPSIRRLAQQLGVSPNTVVVAYDRLVAEAALEARGKAGYFVSPWVHGGAETAALLEPCSKRATSRTRCGWHSNPTTSRRACCWPAAAPCR
jgi:DNA-binding transcriptional regulator YhcF (GntR family)